MFDLDSMCAELPIQEFEDGDLMISEGKKAGGLYFLKSGKVSIYRGTELITELSEPGTVFGEISQLLDCPAISDTRASGKASFYVARDAEAFLLEHPEVALHVSRELAKKMHFMASYLTDLKQQYAGAGNHLGMVHDVLDSFLNHKS